MACFVKKKSWRLIKERKKEFLGQLGSKATIEGFEFDQEIINKEQCHYPMPNQSFIFPNLVFLHEFD